MAESMMTTQDRTDRITDLLLDFFRDVSGGKTSVRLDKNTKTIHIRSKPKSPGAFNSCN